MKSSQSASTAAADIGLIGLAVMGQNLVLNMADHGFTVAVFNRTVAKTHDFLATTRAQEPCRERVLGFDSLKAFIASIKRPRRIVLLVQAGAAVDSTIASLLGLLDKDDIIIDGGNSLWDDTIRRERELSPHGVHFVGSGVSGGETGARFGPSLMAGGSRHAWSAIRPIWRAIAARVDKKTGRPLPDGTPGNPAKGGVPCAAHIGPDGAGHYVKMVHNGIEYGDMQLICESYMLMKQLLGLKPPEMADIFAQWNEGDLDSYLIEITADILAQRDPANRRKWLVDSVLDTAGQKGTGKWTAKSALDMGVAAPSIAEAVFARCMSAQKEQRVTASKVLRGPKPKPVRGKAALLKALHDALYCAKICSYAQGFALMAEAQHEYHWRLKFGELAMIWRGGCIIRARFLQKIKEAYDKDRKLQNLLLDPYFRRALHAGHPSLRRVVALAAEQGIPCPQMMSALAYYDSYRSAVLPANLLQAQRDYFGAHTFERVDAKRGEYFHVDWPDPARPIEKMA